MKTIFLIGGLCFFAISDTRAQTWAEWFRQGETQKKYLVQQIAALKVYLEYAQKGYAIASKGINTIRNIKKGEFKLHQDFFGSLKQVNPAITRYVKVAGIIGTQIKIVKQSKAALKAVMQDKKFTPEERGYLKKVLEGLLDGCAQAVDELTLVIASGELEMRDDERLQRIEHLYAAMQDNYTYSYSFTQELRLLSTQRKREHLQINLSKKLNGVK